MEYVAIGAAIGLVGGLFAAWRNGRIVNFINEWRDGGD
jgi:uncharacterized membrane protein